MDISLMQDCELWEGSNLQIAHKYSCLTLDMMIRKRDMLKRCTDLTPREVQFLRAITASIDAARAKLVS